MLTVAVANQKGGVGKTSTTLGLAAAAAHAGRRVLVVDLDPQANASTALGVTDDGYTSNDVLYANLTGCAADAVRPTGWGEQIGCIPASLALAEREADPALGIEFRLRKALAGVDGFDLCLLDCPPSLGRLVVNALVAATHLLIVTTPQAHALLGVQHVLDTAAVVGEHYNPALTLAGIVVNQVPARAREADYRLAELTAVFGALVWQPVIPTRVVIAEAIGAAAPLHAFTARARDVLAIFAALTDRLLALASRR